MEKIHNKLLTSFSTIQNKDSYEDYIEYLKEDEDRRKKFYEDVSTMIKELNVCRSLPDFYSKITPEKLDYLAKDLKRFIEIKKITQTVMAERVDFSKYEDQIRKILDKYVTAEGVEVLSKPINLSDVMEFNRFIEDANNGLSARSKAEAIAAQTQKTISERWEQDPIFYDKFSRQVKAIIESLRMAKKEDLNSLLQQAKKLQKEVDDYEDNDIPESIREQKPLHPYYRLLSQELKENASQEQLIQIAQRINKIIQQEKIVDWKENIEVKRQVRDRLEDFFFDEVKKEMDIDISVEFIENFIENVWNLATKND